MYHSTKYPTVVRKRITVKSFSNGMASTRDEKVSDLSTAKFLYNFDASSGTLKNGVGIVRFSGFDLTALSSIAVVGVYFYKRFDADLGSWIEKIIYYCSDKRLYIANMEKGTFKKISDVLFNEKPIAISYDYLDRDIMLFASSSGETYYLDNDNLIKIDGAPNITSLCVHKERIFVTTGGEGTSLWFSDDFDPTNWVVSLTEAGFIDFQGEGGKLLKVVSFLDYVYVFREYGISRVTAYGNQEEFSTDTIFGNVGKIYGGSVTNCGDFIIFLSTAGIFRFNGLDVVKILPEYDEYLLNVSNNNCKGVFINNVLYLMVRFNYGNKTETVIIVYDVRKKSSYIAKGLKVTDFEFFSGNVNKVVCLVAGDKSPFYFRNNGALDGTPLVKEWISPYYDFGVLSKLKRLYKLSLYTLESLTLTVECDNKKLTYKFQGGGLQEVYPALQGERFRISIKSTTLNPEICNLSVFVEYVKGAI